MNVTRILLAAGSLALLAGPASAAIFSYTLTGAYTGRFSIDDSSLSPPSTFNRDYFEVENVAGTFNGVTGPTIVAFNTLANNGGLILGDDFTNLWGDQLFGGTTAMPRLNTGSFTLAIDGDATQAVNLTVSAGAVPEPATWAMMALGFGLVGAALRPRARPAVRAV